MQVEKDEGVVLQAVPFQDHHHIVTVYARSAGLLKLFVRGTTRGRGYSHALVTPLTRIEFSYTAKSTSQLAKLRDGSVIDAHVELRQDLEKLNAGCSLAQGLISTQMPGKPSPALYQLFLTYLRGVADETPEPLAVSFLLKLLKHEGLLQLHSTCSECGEKLLEAHLEGAEAYCAKHASPQSIFFKEDERATLLHLVSSRSLKEILQHRIDASMTDRVKTLFNHLT